MSALAQRRSTNRPDGSMVAGERIASNIDLDRSVWPNRPQENG